MKPNPELWQRMRALPDNVKRVLFVRKRLPRLRELNAPQIIIDREEELLATRMKALSLSERTMLTEELVQDWLQYSRELDDGLNQIN